MTAFTTADGWFDADAAANAAFWSGQAAQARQQQEALKRTLALKGQTLVVTRGRKIKLGTTGVCFWVGETKYGWRVGFKDADGETFWTALGNVEAVADDDEASDEALEGLS